MSAIKTTLGIIGVAALGVGAFEAAQWIPGALHSYHVAEGPTKPIVHVVKWSPGKIFPLSGFNNSNGNAGANPTSTLAPTSLSSSVNATSLNWAGLVQEGTTETSVQASWKVPSFPTTATNPNSVVAEWVGLGGMNSNSLIQIGTITSPNSNGQASTTVFWEHLPSSAVQVANVATGATVTAKIGPTGVKNQWRLWLEVNGQTKPLINRVITLTPAKAQGVETSADWITEAPTTNQGVAPLAPVSSTTMTNIEANGVPLAKMNANSLQTIGLYNQDGELLAAPTSDASKDSVTVNTVYGSTLPSPTVPGSGTSPFGPEPGFGGGSGNPFGGGGFGFGGGLGNPFGGSGGFGFGGGLGNPFGSGSGFGFGSGSYSQGGIGFGFSQSTPQGQISWSISY